MRTKGKHPWEIKNTKQTTMNYQENINNKKQKSKLLHSTKNVQQQRDKKYNNINDHVFDREKNITMKDDIMWYNNNEKWKILTNILRRMIVKNKIKLRRMECLKILTFENNKSEKDNISAKKKKREILLKK